MKKLIIKIGIYAILMLICFELVVRVFNLQEEHPVFIINDLNVKTYAPNQKGYYVTGNRRMNFAEYNINNQGFNSYKAFQPTKNKFNVAIIGDSFIEGLHQNYYNSIGKKIENYFKDRVDVFQLGHSGYDLADQFNLIEAYKDDFETIDLIVIYLKFENDIQRDHYTPDYYWINSQYFTFSKIKKQIKLFAYLESIGCLDHLRDLRTRFQAHTPQSKKMKVSDTMNKNYLTNFKILTKTYNFDKKKTVFLLDQSKTYSGFLNYCDSLDYKYIDFGKAMKASKQPTTLIYDMHWNNHGRKIISDAVIKYIQSQNLLQ
ncbi:hypothetical protein KFZ70_13680 [Tamlana fucoidanivorans]|uniref:SGNH/GDSL hydrolase family protein n=1 Tax=Allotamlana fucoidanivorans TaxID=2583814 RepID=A0A5C4SQ92_9FLAO|nr:hypothetical protein [Tamlana fucoidanivorans]TNJ46478.1 hypothetical protein FGF67_02300 [Tamlana fucoidanivorans]